MDRVLLLPGPKRIELGDAMAESPRPKPKIETSNWARERPKPDSGVERRRALWSAVNAFVVKHGGWITSPADTATIRIEAPTSSPLPSLLADLGYSVLHVATGTRLMPNATTDTITAHSTGAPIIRPHPGWLPVDILEIKIP